MQIEMNTIPRLTIQGFAVKHNLVMTVSERERQNWCRSDNFKPYYANFKGASVKDGSILRSAFGDGHTPDQAIENYAQEISNSVLVFNPYNNVERKEIKVPYLVPASETSDGSST